MQGQSAMVHYCRHRSVWVASHIIIVVTLRVRALGNGCATLERETFSLAGSLAGCGQTTVRLTMLSRFRDFCN
jgi:hypothetical protein